MKNPIRFLSRQTTGSRTFYLFMHLQTRQTSKEIYGVQFWTVYNSGQSSSREDVIFPGTEVPQTGAKENHYQNVASETYLPSDPYELTAMDVKWRM